MTRRLHSRRLNRLLATVALAGCGLLVAACGDSNVGTINGHLEASGSAALTPLSGRVTAIGQDGSSVSVSVSSNGTFTLHLAPGTYVVGGSSPSYGKGRRVCHTVTPDVAVSAGVAESVIVGCIER
jgi:spore coat protein U-like protein